MPLVDFNRRHSDIARVSHPIRPLSWLQGGIELFLSRWYYVLALILLQSLVSLITLGILAGPLSVGLYRILDRLQDEPEYRPTLRDLFNGFDRFTDSVLFFFIWGVVALLVIQFIIFIPLIGVLVSVVIVLFILPLAQFGFPLIGLHGHDWRAASMLLLTGLTRQPVLLPMAAWLFALLPLAGALLLTRAPLAGFFLSVALSGVTFCSVSFASRYLTPWLTESESEPE